MSQIHEENVRACKRLGLFLERPERIFFFIDETGDPGHPSQRDASRFYQLNIVVAARSGIREIVKHFSRLRYLSDADKELERYISRKEGVIRDLFEICAKHPAVAFFSFFLHKEKYVGPYLKRIGVGKHDYDANKFRNFVVRKSLEQVCMNVISSVSEITTEPEIELVFDRYLASEDDEQNLKKYLRGNYQLPNFLHIIQVDSEYSDLVQVADLLGRLVKRSVFDENGDAVDFVHLYCLENPDKLYKRKGPGHP